jgi:hypothetical protein
MRFVPKVPPDFDCCHAGQVLRLRFRDWMWPLAILTCVGVFVASRPTSPNGVYRIGSLTYYANMLGPLVVFVLVPLAGARWCWLGRVRPMPAGRCGGCGYDLAGLAAAGASGGGVRCPECGVVDSLAVVGAGAATRRPRRRVPLVRRLIDLPGLLLMLTWLYMVVAVGLIIFGVIDD